MNSNKRIESGIPIREKQVRNWLDGQNFKGEYLLVSTKPELIYFRKLQELSPETKLIVDLYTPIFLEKELTLSKWKPQDWLTRFRNKEMVKKFLRRGNHFLVANHRQKDYWLETSKSLGLPLKLNDISVFPTGSLSTINHQPLTINSRKVVLWFGGIYPWIDPMPLVEAFGNIAKKFPNWKLRFLGGFHPDTGYIKQYNKIQSLAKSKIPESQIEFIPWQTESNLIRYLSDVAFSVHLPKQTLEDYYAHRVRLLTLMNAGIGVLTSGRDIISDILIKSNAGMRVRRQVDTEKILVMAMNESKLRQKWSQNALRLEKVFVKQELDIGSFSYFQEFENDL
jgi:glycosyltransferase involved in cell wall biosynthesis